MNVCDYCGAVYNDTCGGCASRHIVLNYNIYDKNVRIYTEANRYQAEKRADSQSLMRAWDSVIIPYSLWVETIDKLVSEDWRP